MTFFAFDFVGAKQLRLGNSTPQQVGQLTQKDDAKDEGFQPDPDPLHGKNPEKNLVAQRAHFCKEFR